MAKKTIEDDGDSVDISGHDYIRRTGPSEIKIGTGSDFWYKITSESPITVEQIDYREDNGN